MTNEPTSSDILEAIQDFATHVDRQFHTVNNRLHNIESSMVTKSYLDDKLGDLRGDLVMLARKGNTKLSTLVEDLERQHVLDHDTARRILALEPFPERN